MSVDKRIHRTRGEVTIFADMGENFKCFDRSGSFFECTALEFTDGVASTGSGSVVNMFPEQTNKTVPLTPDKPQVNINAVTASELNRAVKGIGRSYSTQLINNKPIGGYVNFNQLRDLNIEIPSQLFDALKSDGVIIFN